MYQLAHRVGSFIILTQLELFCLLTSLFVACFKDCWFADRPWQQTMIYVTTGVNRHKHWVATYAIILLKSFHKHNESGTTNHIWKFSVQLLYPFIYPNLYMNNFVS